MGLFYLASKAKQFRHLGEKSFEDTFKSGDLFSRLNHVVERCFRFVLGSSASPERLSGKVSLVHFNGEVVAFVGNKPIAKADADSCEELTGFLDTVPELCGEIPGEIVELEVLTNSFQAKIVLPETPNKEK